MLSILIPAREEKYLEPTLKNILENAGGEIEIIVMLDGWKPNPPILIDDDRIIYVYNKESIGQRQSINAAARMARGKYVMKLDAHCAVAKDFDIILARDCEYDMTMIPRMYNLDIEKFKPKMHKLTDYMYIGMVDGNLRAQYFRSKDKPKDRDKIMIDDIMCCMGPGFFMHKDRFWELGGCDEEHGGWGQQGVEVACKAWLSGGRLVVNKNTWFAHWFRGSHQHDNGRRGFPYSIRQSQVNVARRHSNDLWLNNKWEKQTRTFQWLVEKFNPPTWREELEKIKLNALFYKWIHRRRNLPSWKGVEILKMPSDLTLYQEIIYETKPDYILEIGTKFGGSALYFQDMLDIHNPGGKVITVDIKPQVAIRDSRIEYIISNSIDKALVKSLKERLSGKKVMVIIDGNHNRAHVKWELHHYSPLIKSGQYIVIEDCYIDRGLYGPGEARDWFLSHYKTFKQTDRDKRYKVGVCMGGWIRKI